MVYGTEAVLPAEVVVASARLSLALEEGLDRLSELETVEDQRDKAAKNTTLYQEEVARLYKKTVCPRSL